MQYNVKAPESLLRQEKIAAGIVEVKADTVISALKEMSPAKAADWIQENINNLITAKEVLKVFAKVLVVLLKKL